MPRPAPTVMECQAWSGPRVILISLMSSTVHHSLSLSLSLQKSRFPGFPVSHLTASLVLFVGSPPPGLTLLGSPRPQPKALFSFLSRLSTQFCSFETNQPLAGGFPLCLQPEP
jgi:hypothetical protein